MKEIGEEELLEWAKLNKVNISQGQAQEILQENTNVDLDEFLKENGNAISEYESLSKKMKKKVALIMDSLKESDQKGQSGESDKNEKDTLDEKEGKEQLAEEKEEKLKERNLENTDEKEQKDKEGIEEEPKEENEKYDEKTIINKDEYLANVKKLHEMRLREYKDEMKKDDVTIDKHFMKMVYLQRTINTGRKAFIKEYGVDELASIENDFAKEELKYEKILYKRREQDMVQLGRLDKKMDEIIDKMKVLQQNLEDKSISQEEYNNRIEGLEKEKIETLWNINKLNPNLMQEKQDRNIARDELEDTITSRGITGTTKNYLSKENNEKKKYFETKEERQQGIPKEIEDNINDNIKSDINEKEKRLDELREHLKKIDIKSPAGKEEALDVIAEIQTLEAQKMSQELQQENLDKNMATNKASYGDLEGPNVKRQEATNDMQEIKEDVNVNEVSDDMMEQLRSAAIKDPETPEQAEEYLDSIEKQAEDTAKETNEKEVEEDYNAPTLLNRKRRPY